MPFIIKKSFKMNTERLLKSSLPLLPRNLGFFFPPSKYIQMILIDSYFFLTTGLENQMLLICVFQKSHNMRDQ